MNNKKIGMIFGGFYPLHNGHMNLIDKAYLQCDKLIIVNSTTNSRSIDSEKEIGIPNRPITPEIQIQWLSEELSDYENIVIKSLDEDAHGIPENPNGWKQWSSLVKWAFFNYEEDIPTHIFTADPQYKDNINKYFPTMECVVVEKEVDICATTIRSDIYKYWEFLPRSVKRYYTRRIVITGTESCGKTTLCNMLAHKFNTNKVSEYGREYVLSNHIDERYLKSSDYSNIAEQHYKNIHNESCNSNKILIIDTDAIVTQYYHKLYNGCHENIDVTKTIELMNIKLLPDLYLCLDDDVKWVDDGLRNNGTERERELCKALFKNIFDGCRILRVPVSYISGNYENRYNSCVKILSELLSGGK